MATEKLGAETGYPAHITDGDIATMVFKCEPHGREASKCEECAAAEREAFSRADTYPAYVDSTFSHMITFGGFWLAQIKRHDVKKRRWTPTGTGSYRMAYVSAVSPDGAHWHGSYNYDGGGLVTLHRSKSRGN